jgi:hypothetical protein
MLSSLKLCMYFIFRLVHQDEMGHPSHRGGGGSINDKHNTTAVNSKMGPHNLPLRYTSQQLDIRPPAKRFTLNGAGKQDITTRTMTLTTTFCGVGTFSTFLWITNSSCSVHHCFGRPLSRQRNTNGGRQSPIVMPRLYDNFMRNLVSIRSYL